MTKYRELQKLVYSVLYPDGIPFEFDEEVLYKIKDWRRGMRMSCREVDTFEKAHNQLLTILDKIDKMNWENKPLQGFDILRAMNKVILSQGFMIDDAGIIYERNDHFVFKGTGIEIDLSLPIKDHPDETLQKIINLIK